jgi:hypothetical protein
MCLRLKVTEERQTNVTNVRAAAIADADLCANTVDFRLPNSTKLPHDNDNIVSTVTPGIKTVLGLYRQVCKFSSLAKLLLQSNATMHERPMEVTLRPSD